MHFIVDATHESAEGAEAGGTFQIGSIEMAEDKGGETRDATGEVDREVYFSGEDDLREYLAITFKVPAEEVEIEFV